jgi:hypothetical protein
MTSTAIDSKNTSGEPRFAVPGMFTPSPSCPITSRVDPRKSRFHQSSRGNGARRATSRAATRIATPTESANFTSHCDCLCPFRDRRHGAEPSRKPASGASDLGLSRAEPDYVDQCGARGDPRVVARAECVPNLTRRFAARLANDAKVRKQLKYLDEQSDVYGPAELTSD